MKASAAYLLTALLSVTQARAECVEGTREEISPGYTVEHKCDIYRQGDISNGINSATDCAALARDAGVSVSTYHAPTKRCIVGREDGKDLPRAGTIYMQKVVEEVEDPFAVEEDVEDPFALDCEGEKADCLLREANLKVELATAQAQLIASEAESTTGKADSALIKDMLAANCPSQHSKYGIVAGKEYKFWCTRYHDPSSPKEKHPNVNTMEACVKLCTARSWCTYALHGAFQTNCQLYDRKVSHTTSPGHTDNMWNCAVKK
ncbi:hypothetical protein FSARC_8244 [Fusarium sarcochroum]|uniref:Apple domain-containing protein n=1 Tax=Fusarium sarcochroum TaxID=1208366 RepID=A0A8H4TTH5_9HYPO|nr:hypothetical protein FSARC_8244 [Fusarium sarcochroum]